MILHTLAAAFLSATPTQTPSPSGPLAAPFVDHGKLVLVDLPTLGIEQIPLGDLIAEDADMTWDKKKIVVSAHAHGGRSRLYLVDAETGKYVLLPVPLESDEVSPRFAEDGKVVLFSAPLGAQRDSGVNHLRVHRYMIGDERLDDLPTDPERCEQSPVAFGAGRVAYVSTSCFIEYDLRVAEAGKPKPRVVDQIPFGKQTELAASHDGRTLLLSGPTRAGQSFFVELPNQKPKFLASVARSGLRVQPHFISGSDVLFLNRGHVWLLSADTGAVKDIVSLRDDRKSPIGGSDQSDSANKGTVSP